MSETLNEEEIKRAYLIVRNDLIQLRDKKEDQRWMSDQIWDTIEQLDRWYYEQYEKVDYPKNENGMEGLGALFG